MSSVETAATAAPIGALTIAGACKIYNIGRTFLYEEIKAGRIAARKAGKRTLILKRDMEAWANSLPTLGTAR